MIQTDSADFTLVDALLYQPETVGFVRAFPVASEGSHVLM